METYIHDYSIPHEVEAKIGEACSKCQNPEVKQLISEARMLLKKYLSQENLIEKDDMKNGFVRRYDAQIAVEDAKEAYIESAIAYVEKYYKAEEEDPVKLLVNTYRRPGWCIDLVIYQVPTWEDLFEMCGNCGRCEHWGTQSVEKRVECWERRKNAMNYDNCDD